MHKRTTHLSTQAIPQSPHKVCLMCYSKKKKLIIFVKEEDQLDYKVHLSINFCKLLFSSQIYFSISYLPFSLNKTVYGCEYFIPSATP